MKKIFAILITAIALCGCTKEIHEAQWIVCSDEATHEAGAWTCFRKDVSLAKVPVSAVARIAADSKYWLWINGNLAVFEGGLKRGPNREDTYVDEVDIAPWLHKGDNSIALIVWHFGKSGFSHIDSGKCGLFFECPGVAVSDSTFLSMVHPAYSKASSEPVPNYRLSENNIRYDAGKEIEGWISMDASGLIAEGFTPAAAVGAEGCEPWNKLISRPIPQWKDFGILEAKFGVSADDVSGLMSLREGCTLYEAVLPYNMQMTPVISLNDQVGGQTVDIFTDHILGGGEYTVRSEYVTRCGTQTYESFGWMNGQKIYIRIPEGITLENVAYRETGYNAEPAPGIECSSEFWSRYWEKARNTLYVNMRDTYYDCPDRERSQWWGDAVLLSSLAQYMYTREVDALTRKGVLELAAFQEDDGSLHSPVPGIYDLELQGQMLASVGRYGFWNYYLNTGDIETLRTVYPAVRRYLLLFEADDTGLLKIRRTDKSWYWGDWGYNQDKRLIYAALYAIALQSAADMANVLELPADASEYIEIYAKLKDGFNLCWQNDNVHFPGNTSRFAYRSPEYELDTDDRVQALAVLAGFATEDKFEDIFRNICDKRHASPYMEKYIAEALFAIGHGDHALQRIEERFGTMIADTIHTTLYEGWEIDSATFGGGSTNHAWSGGPILCIYQNVLGIKPLSPAWTSFSFAPRPCGMDYLEATIPAQCGEIKASFKRNTDGSYAYTLTVPAKASATVTINGMTTVLAPGTHKF